MKKNIGSLLGWYAAGFILGIIGANLLFKETGCSSGLLAIYGTAAQKELVNAEVLFKYLLFQRGAYFLVMWVFGRT